LKPLADVTDHRDDPPMLLPDVLNVEELWGYQEIAGSTSSSDQDVRGPRFFRGPIDGSRFRRLAA
jgi:hypothetical protein